ncbi:hypothetical protein Pmar_PMAR003519 [Perkinsus marinus ATCC 50983]|uniref:Uncharacterized protein n=1 Tax=Perkinsus marinus (strain ATCC 50983 / TXsc) TaxID=423536 RepID=C5KHJ4_PERM5|nr:hypothetical protein Pmar_PMAR003519 [Perkinsus marinus ATCC 50983]EER16056.1 hypothetical protein Pmar_PMAR003519 [Perkinsus marinus ATCC 50983]|eukprot:XP_002784260.1 hypothetical protein Pmar_PMAR003519 [Perkinsus marinus ATCC 50983]
MGDTRSTDQSHESSCSRASGEEGPSGQLFDETATEPTTGQCPVVQDVMKKLYPNVSAPVRAHDSSSSAESSHRDEGPGDPTWACLKPDCTFRAIDSSELTILVNSKLDDHERLTTESAITVPVIDPPPARKDRALTLASGHPILTLSGSRLLNRRTKRFHTVGLASEARAVVGAVRAQS